MSIFFYNDFNFLIECFRRIILDYVFERRLIFLGKVGSYILGRDIFVSFFERVFLVYL